MADEPIAEVDTENADIILEALWDVIRRDGAVLAATHNPEALRYANCVVLFRDGVVEQSTPQEVANRTPHGRLARGSSPARVRTGRLVSVLARWTEDLAVDVDHASLSAICNCLIDRATASRRASRGSADGGRGCTRGA